MKLERLTSTTETLTSEARERARAAAPEPRVEALEGLAGDRQRSLRQEFESIEALAIAEYGGQALQLATAQQVAADLLVVGRQGGQALLREAGLLTTAARLLHLDARA